MFSIFGLLCGSLQTLNVATGKSLGDGKRDEFLARQHFTGDTLAQLWVGEVKYWRKTDDGTSLESIAIAACIDSCELLCDNKLKDS